MNFRVLALAVCPTLGLLFDACGRYLVRRFLEERRWEAPPSEELAQLLRSEPRRGLEPGEKERFEEDGVLLIRGLLTSPVALEWLRNVSFPDFSANVLPVNGPMLSLARDSPLGPVTSELLGGVPLRVWSGQYFNRRTYHVCNEKNSFSACDAPHLDLDAEANGELLPFVSAWLALTEANHSVGFMLGSHTARHPCGYSDDVVDDGCLVELAANLTRKRGSPSIVSYALAPGDAVFFYNQVFHYGKEDTETPLRVGASVRYVRADYGFQGPIVETTDIVNWFSQLPRECSPLGSRYLFPLADAPEEAGKWPRGWPVHPTLHDLWLSPSRSWQRERTDTFAHCPNYA